MQAILTSAAPLLIVIPDHGAFNEQSIATRIAHDLSTYHKLDAEIMTASQALKDIKNQSISQGNIVVIGDAGTPLVQWALDQHQTAFEVEGKTLKLRNRLLVERALGINIVISGFRLLALRS